MTVGFSDFLVFVAFIAFFIPRVVAAVRRHPKANKIVVLNFVLPILVGLLAVGFFSIVEAEPNILIGVAVILWLALLVWAFSRFEKPKKSE